MNKNTNIFICILIALSINLQCNISAYAEDENTTLDTEEQSLDQNTDTEQTTGLPIEDGNQLTEEPNAPDQMQQN